MRKSRFSEEQKVKMLREAEQISVVAVAEQQCDSPCDLAYVDDSPLLAHQRARWQQDFP